MKKYLFFFVITLFYALGTSAQTAKELFRAMPDSILPLLSANNRADCTDFIESKMKAEVTNAFKEKTVMTDLTTDYIAINLSVSSNWQMKVLPSSNGKIICVVNTVMGPVADSNITFYTDKWTPLSAERFIKLPTMDDFFKAPIATDNNDSLCLRYTNLRRQADMLLIKAQLGKNDATLTLTFTTPEYLGWETAKEMKTFLREPIKYSWQKNKFDKE